MKIALASDVHLEFGDIVFKNTDNVDVLILSGDICVAKDLETSDKSKKIMQFFEVCSKEFPHVIYIMGNHEHYNGDFATTIPIFQKHFSHLTNLYVFNKEYKIIDGVVFFGGTLWTDMNREDPNTLWGIKRVMNDFRIITNSNNMTTHKVPIYDKENPSAPPVYRFKERPSIFSPEDTVKDHKEYLTALKQAIDAHDMPFVVVGHHAPSKLSTHPRYKHETMVNGAYSSDLSEFILDNPKIKVWTHGHTHECFDYTIGSTRIISNPRGYVNYERGSQETDPYYPKIFTI